MKKEITRRIAVLILLIVLLCALNFLFAHLYSKNGRMVFPVCGIVCNLAVTVSYFAVFLRKHAAIRKSEPLENGAFILLITFLSLSGSFSLPGNGAKVMNILSLVTFACGMVLCIRMHLLSGRNADLNPGAEENETKPVKKSEKELEEEENERWFREHTRGVR